MSQQILTVLEADANHVKVITRHVWQDAEERVDAHRKTPAGAKLYARRKETVERSFADGK